MPRAGPLTGRFWNRTAPALGLSSPHMSLSNVDLPQPDGPTIDTKLPALMPHDRFSNTVSVRPCTGNVLARSFSSMIGAAKIGSGDGGACETDCGRALQSPQACGAGADCRDAMAAIIWRTTSPESARTGAEEPIMA